LDDLDTVGFSDRAPAIISHQIRDFCCRLAVGAIIFAAEPLHRDRNEIGVWRQERQGTAGSPSLVELMPVA